MRDERASFVMYMFNTEPHIVISGKLWQCKVSAIETYVSVINGRMLLRHLITCQRLQPSRDETNGILSMSATTNAS